MNSTAILNETEVETVEQQAAAKLLDRLRDIFPAASHNYLVADGIERTIRVEGGAIIISHNHNTYTYSTGNSGGYHGQSLVLLTDGKLHHLQWDGHWNSKDGVKGQYSCLSPLKQYDLHWKWEGYRQVGYISPEEAPGALSDEQAVQVDPELLASALRDAESRLTECVANRQQQLDTRLKRVREIIASLEE